VLAGEAEVAVGAELEVGEVEIDGGEGVGETSSAGAREHPGDGRAARSAMIPASREICGGLRGARGTRETGRKDGKRKR
jgi:hypothetical protein